MLDLLDENSDHLKFDYLQNGHRLIVTACPPQIVFPKIKWPPKTKLSITQSIFKLEAPDFTWKFTMTLCNYFYPKNKMAIKKTKWSPKTKLSITQSIFKLEVPDFAW